LLYFAILLCFAFGLDDSALADSVGRVSKVQNQAQVGSIPAAVGTSVGMGDTLRTGANARLEVTFRDGTKLTLGENARVVIDRYVYNPDKRRRDGLKFNEGSLAFHYRQNPRHGPKECHGVHAVRGTCGSRNRVLDGPHG